MGIGDHKAQKPNLDQILGSENRILSIFLRGQLVLESVLNSLIQTKEPISDKNIIDLTSAGKVAKALQLGLISQEMRDFLTEVNRLRNKFAHRLGYDLTESDVHELIKLASKAPEIDFTDDMHLLDMKTLYEWYTDTAGVLEEMFKHAAMDLSFIVEENGGEFMFAN